MGEGARKDSGELIAPSVKVGDIVLFGKWSGTEVTLNGEELLIMKEGDIMGSSADPAGAARGCDPLPSHTAPFQRNSI